MQNSARILRHRAAEIRSQYAICTKMIFIFVYIAENDFRHYAQKAEFNSALFIFYFIIDGQYTMPWSFKYSQNCSAESNIAISLIEPL